MKVFKNPPQGTHLISLRTAEEQEYAAKRFLSDLECYMFLKTVPNAETVFRTTPDKNMWKRLTKRFGRETVGQAYRYWSYTYETIEPHGEGE